MNETIDGVFQFRNFLIFSIKKRKPSSNSNTARMQKNI